MFEEIYDPFLINNSRSNKTFPRHRTVDRWRIIENGFECRHCRAYVHTLVIQMGVQNRNHCPYCLWSRHVDYLRPGDRMSACKGIMQPIGLSMKRRRTKYAELKSGELMLIHRCNECDKVSLNRIAADDLADGLMRLFQESLSIQEDTRIHLEVMGIHLLGEDSAKLISDQIWGSVKN